MVGEGTKTLISRALEPDKQHFLEKVLEKMRGKYAKICLNKTKPYKGLPQVIGELAKKSVKLAVLTNKDQKMAERIVNYFFDSYFDIIAGATASIAVKPDPTQTLQIVDKFKLKPQEAVFIGDSNIDMQTAKTCKMFAVGVSWGLGSIEELKENGADIIIDRSKKLLEIFN
jgi:phosphoglycolate phosphatase